MSKNNYTILQRNKTYSFAAADGATLAVLAQDSTKTHYYASISGNLVQIAKAATLELVHDGISYSYHRDAKQSAAKKSAPMSAKLVQTISTEATKAGQPLSGVVKIGPNEYMLTMRPKKQPKK